MSSNQRRTQKCSSMWIHCNRCFENYINKQRSIYILSCYDVVCEKCLITGNNNEKKCSMCENIVKAYPIGNNLSANLKDLFHPRPWILSFNKALSVMKFQTNQRDHFSLGCKKLKEYNESMEIKKEQLKEECKQLYLTQKKQKNEKLKLQACLKKLKEIRLSKQVAANQGFDKNQSSEFEMFDMMQQNKRRDREIPSTCHLETSRSRIEDSFYFPPDDSLSKSFYL